MDNYKLYKYINDKSILVITPKNELKRLYCPFPVKDKNGNIYNVMGIEMTNDFTIIYLINGKHYLYKDFQIVE
jgi:hypothetical protein